MYFSQVGNPYDSFQELFNLNIQIGYLAETLLIHLYGKELSLRPELCHCFSKTNSIKPILPHSRIFHKAIYFLYSSDSSLFIEYAQNVYPLQILALLSVWKIGDV